MASFPNEQSNPAGAIPVYDVSGSSAPTNIVDASAALTASTPLTVLPADVARRYLLIQSVSVPPVDIWMNFTGAPAAIGGSGSVKLAAGQVYESGPIAPANPVSLIAAANTTATVWKG